MLMDGITSFHNFSFSLVLNAFSLFLNVVKESMYNAFFFFPLTMPSLSKFYMVNEVTLTTMVLMCKRMNQIIEAQ